MTRQDWTAARIAEVVEGALASDAAGSAQGFTTDTREVSKGDLFVGIPGARVDGGDMACDAFEHGAWGALVTPAAAKGLDMAGVTGALVVHPDPTRALGLLAAERRRLLDVPVIGITGSTGKTSTKDILGAVLGTAGEVFVSAGNRNTDVGLPLELLRVPETATAVVLEMAMRAEGEIADLARIATPDAGVVVNVGPVHLETLGSIERVASAKAELFAGLRPGSIAVHPAGDGLLAPHLRSDLVNISFGPGGDCRLVSEEGRVLTVATPSGEHRITVDFDQPHNRLNLLAAVAVASGLGYELPDTLTVPFSGLRGERKAFENGVVVIDDCYNANPMSMRAALADLAAESERRGGRAVAVLGNMLELGPQSGAHHASLGPAAAEANVGLLITVGDHAAAALAGFPGDSVAVDTAAQAATALAERLSTGDTVLVKGSRGVGLEAVAESLGSGVS